MNKKKKKWKKKSEKKIEFPNDVDFELNSKTLYFFSSSNTDLKRLNVSTPSVRYNADVNAKKDKGQGAVPGKN